MRTLFITLLSCMCLVAHVSRPIAQASEEDTILEVIVHRSSRIARLSGAEVEALFTRSQTRWSDGSPVVPLSLPTGTKTRDQFDRTVLRLDADQVGRFWLERRIRGLGAPPKQVPNAALMLKVVANLPGSIGYMPMSRIHVGVKVVARIAEGRVLSP
jgi:ABC-type phosphate transport system substrate-binding protein